MTDKAPAITPRTVKQKLKGCRFKVQDQSGTRVPFSFPDSYDKLTWPRQGLEGIVTPVTCHHPVSGDVPSILKLFYNEIPVRNIRVRHLLHFGLATTHEWLYEGVPFTWVNMFVNGVRVHGHVTRHVCHDRKGDEFKIVRDDDIDSYSEENRRELAAQLCCNIVGLERLGLAHGDLSARNIVIGRKGPKDVRCVVIDYDGFHSASVIKLPRKFGGMDARPLGTPGYQHPSLMRRIAADKTDDDSIYVPNDRFALAALCYEIMIWTSALSVKLDTDLIMDEQELAKGVLVLDKAVKDTWPEGRRLLEKAVREPDINALPSPEDWLVALGFTGQKFTGHIADWTRKPKVRISQQIGNQAPIPRGIGEIRGTNGDFARADQTLKAVKYRQSVKDGACQDLFFAFDWQAPVILKRQKVTTRLDPKDGEIRIGPGDTLLSNGWVFEFQEGSSSQI